MSDQQPPPEPPDLGGDQPPSPGYWKASDGSWYPPEQAPGVQAPTLPDGSPPQKKSNTTRNVLIGVAVALVLLCGGCAALLFAGGAALDEVTDAIDEELESSRSTTAQSDDDTEAEAEATTVPPFEGPEPTCAYAGTGGLFDYMQVEVTFTNPLGEVNDFDLTYALLDGEGGTRFFTDDTSFSQWNRFPRANEQFRVTLDTREDVPPNIDEATIGCTVLEIEKPSFNLGGFERASDADTCEVLGIDSSGVPSKGIQVEVAVTSPYEDTTTVQTWWALEAPGPVRFDADTEVTDLVGGGETFRITPQSGVDKPEWVGDDEVTCTVLGFWDQGR